MRKNKLYMAREGRFFSNWGIENYKAFLTKRALHNYMKEKMGFGFSRSKKTVYMDYEEIYENITEEYGYEVVEVELEK